MKVTQVVIQGVAIHSPTPDNPVLAPNRVTSSPASALLSTGQVEAFSTDNHALCRVKQLLKVEDSHSQERKKRCEAVDFPFRANEDDDEEVPGNEILGPSLRVRKQRARAAQLYKNAVS
ncbi:hypothetical protein JG688_00005652 [Phytophthora aleatoria]|uniref:Uncharacterized protein n=1 Tax=Phytophthora aleatoria TaxID=2496075 RepID=A0A8J5MHG2_9STRA|nr:hypothetical protein JG688_00005652 [Phytophthora aleatoria]